MTTLYDRVMECRLYNERKHDLKEGTAIRELNALTNEEFLQEISDALDELINGRMLGE